jgi:hypothetical protein
MELYFLVWILSRGIGLRLYSGDSYPRLFVCCWSGCPDAWKHSHWALSQHIDSGFDLQFHWNTHANYGAMLSNT